MTRLGAAALWDRSSPWAELIDDEQPLERHQPSEDRLPGGVVLREHLVIESLSILGGSALKGLADQLDRAVLVFSDQSIGIPPLDAAPCR